MRTAKEIFLTSGHSDAWKSFVGSPAFDAACQLALAQLASQVSPTTTPGLPTDPYVAIDANSQIFGARRIIEILSALSEPIRTTTEPKRDTLHY